MTSGGGPGRTTGDPKTRQSIVAGIPDWSPQWNKSSLRERCRVGSLLPATLWHGDLFTRGHRCLLQQTSQEQEAKHQEEDVKLHTNPNGTAPLQVSICVYELAFISALGGGIWGILMVPFLLQKILNLTAQLKVCDFGWLSQLKLMKVLRGLGSLQACIRNRTFRVENAVCAS